MPKTLVVIPTYNEKDNIAALIGRILDLPEKPEVLVVDDDSPDGTSQAVRALAIQNTRVRLLSRKGKGGRGSATLDGFKMALEEGWDYVIEMDADFSHDPNDISRLLALSGQAEMVLGSRYLPESVIVQWPLKRKLFSRLANFYARLILGIPLSDYTNGYRCYSRAALQKLHFEKIPATGYIVLSYVSYQLYKQGARFKEIPIRFVNRRRGASNFSKQEVLQAFSAVWEIRRSWP